MKVFSPTGSPRTELAMFLLCAATTLTLMWLVNGKVELVWVVFWVAIIGIRLAWLIWDAKR